jgi:hypothetical protein
MRPVPFAAMYVAHIMERESCVVPLPFAHLSKISSSLQYILSELHESSEH